MYTARGPWYGPGMPTDRPATPSSPSKPLPRCVELIRVSGMAQAERDTPADQRRALDELRRRRPAIVIARIEEGAAGLSGRLPLERRPDLLQLREILESQPVNEVRVRHLDRLTRSIDPLERALILSMCRRASALMVEASGETLDPRSTAGEITWCVKSIAMAEEVEKIRIRTMEARQRKAGEGCLQNSPPYGRTWDKATGWGYDVQERAVYERIFSLLTAGQGYQAIARTFNGEKIPTPSAGPLGWAAQTVRRLARHPSAIGDLRSASIPMKCPAIVTVAARDHALATVTASNRAGRPSSEVPALVRKVAICGTCGSPMWVVGNNCKRAGDGTVCRYYACKYRTTARNAECHRYHKIEEIDAEVRAVFKAALHRDVMPRTRTGDPAKAIREAKRKIETLEAEAGRVTRIARKAEEPETAEATVQTLKEIGAEIRAARAELATAEQMKTESPKVLIQAKERAEILARIDRAPFDQLREDLLSVLGPRGRVVILPDGSVEIRTA